MAIDHPPHLMREVRAHPSLLTARFLLPFSGSRDDEHVRTGRIQLNRCRTDARPLTLAFERRRLRRLATGKWADHPERKWPADMVRLVRRLRLRRGAPRLKA
jgi:hypothetical protein